MALQLHGRVRNGILVATTWIRLAQENLESDPAGSKEHLEKATRLVERVAYQDLRDITTRLHPLAIRFGLITSLRALTETFDGIFSVGLHFPEDGSLSDDFTKEHRSEGRRIAIYRVVEEALNNVHKHAAADYVEIAVALVRSRLVVRIQDDGRGFDPGTTAPGIRHHLDAGLLRLPGREPQDLEQARPWNEANRDTAPDGPLRGADRSPGHHHLHNHRVARPR